MKSNPFPSSHAYASFLLPSCVLLAFHFYLLFTEAPFKSKHMHKSCCENKNKGPISFKSSTTTPPGKRGLLGLLGLTVVFVWNVLIEKPKQKRRDVLLSHFPRPRRQSRARSKRSVLVAIPYIRQRYNRCLLPFRSRFSLLRRPLRRLAITMTITTNIMDMDMDMDMDITDMVSIMVLHITIIIAILTNTLHHLILPQLLLPPHSFRHDHRSIKAYWVIDTFCRRP